MSSTKQAPTVTELKGGAIEGKRYDHPAFGQISVVKSLGITGGMELFGSPLNHQSVLTITLSTASLTRGLNRDWIFGGKQVVSFQMSESQWAHFLSSQGDGSTPITFETRPAEGSSLMHCPGIESAESMHETHHRELAEACRVYVAKAAELADQLRQAVAEGKANKGKLQELRLLAEDLAEGMPATMQHVQRQGEEAMEKTIAAGKIEIESFVSSLATRTGIEALRSESPALLVSKPADLEVDE